MEHVVSIKNTKPTKQVGNKMMNLETNSTIE